MKRLLAALLLTATLVFGTAAPSGAVEVHAWNTGPYAPINWFGHPLGQTGYTTGEYHTNATLWMTCLLRWTPSASNYTHDGCSSEGANADKDFRNLRECDYTPTFPKQWFVTQTWLTIHHRWGDETIVLYSAPAYIPCFIHR